MLTKVLNIDWEEAYAFLCAKGYEMRDMPSSNAVIVSVLIDNGFEEHSLMRKCKDCYTIDMFCRDHPQGVYAVFAEGHVIACIDGIVYDSFDSRNLIPLFYFVKVSRGRSGEMR